MMITDVEDYYVKGCGRCARFDTPQCSTQMWAPGLAKLRSLCLAADLTETVKWGHPCYTYAGRNIAIFGAFRDNFRLLFFHPALMTDPHKILERRGPNTQHPDMIRFCSNTGPDLLEPVIWAYLDEAKSYAAAGKTQPKDDRDFDLPEELISALDGDPELAEAFHALTRGRQKSYVISLSSAKRTETRIARIIRFRDKILAGKGALER